MRIISYQRMHDFQIKEKVGEGAFAAVYRVTRRQDGRTYALKKIKIVNSNPRDISNCLNEVRILASIDHPYVIGYKEATYDEETGSLLLVTEFASGGDLSAFIKGHQKRREKIIESEIWRMAIQMIHGLRALHRLNIFHRDVKSANILLTENNAEVKLGDMNVSKISKSGLAMTQTGTPYYASPEVWSDLPYNGKCDVWSLGCVLYELASFRPPFMAPDIMALRKKITEGSYDRIPDHYSQDLENFIRLCLCPRPKERPSSQGLLHTSYIRKRIFMYPQEKFNESTYEFLLNKENKLLQTIRFPKRTSFGSELKSRLPRSNYENLSEVAINTDRNRSVSMFRSQVEEKLPEIVHRKSSRQAMKSSRQAPKCLPKSRLIYLR